MRQVNETHSLAERAKAEKLNQPARVLVAAWYRWPTGARVAAALASCGVCVDVICPAIHPLSTVTGISRRFRFGMTSPTLSLGKAIEISQPALILCCDEFTLRQLQSVRMFGPTAVADLVNRAAWPSEAFGAFVSRASLIEIAEAVGVLCPATERVPDATSAARWIDEQGGPAFLKIDGTFGGTGVRRVTEPAGAGVAHEALLRTYSLRRAVQHAVRRQEFSRIGAWLAGEVAEVTIQNEVAGVPANCSAFAWQGELRAIICVEVLRTEADYGVATLVRPIRNTEMEATARALSQRLQLTGVFGLDFIWDRERDRSWLIELNPRPTPISHMNFGYGLDLMAEIARTISPQQDPKARPALPSDRPIALFPHCLKDVSLTAGAVEDLPADQPGLLKLLTPRNKRRKRPSQNSAAAVTGRS